MELSVVIVSYNTKKLTLSCIESVVNDTSEKSKEIIVIDNASSDGSQNEIKKLISKNQKYKSKIKIIENKDNLGFSKANNQGIKVAKGKYILLLNSDTKLVKGSLGRLIDFAKNSENAGVIGARLLNEDGSVQPSCFNFPTIKRAIQQYWFSSGKPLEKYTPNYQTPVTVDAVVGAAFLITPKALGKIGGLDERYFFFYEDLAYCREVWKNGLEVYYLPQAKVYHYHGASGKKLASQSDQWRRLIPSSKIYHGLLGYYIFNFVLWSGQKLRH